MQVCRRLQLRRAKVWVELICLLLAVRATGSGKAGPEPARRRRRRLGLRVRGVLGSRGSWQGGAPRGRAAVRVPPLRRSMVSRSVTVVGNVVARSFGLESSSDVLRHACERVRLGSDGADLLRLGENALYRLAGSPVVVRIARSMDHWAAATKEVAVAQWLAGAGIEAARTWDTEQPVEVDGHPVTFWQLIDGRNGGPGDVVELGSVLRRLHELPAPKSFSLPGDDPLGRVEPRIRAAPIPDEDRRFLAELLGRLREDLSAVRFELAPAAIHGDAHVQNLMFVDERPVLIDFERMAFGQPEWDLSVTATEYATAGWWTDAQYANFVDSYGFDVMTWPGFGTIRRINEIKMTTWLMQNIGESTEVEREYRVRMQTIRGESSGRSWRAF